MTKKITDAKTETAAAMEAGASLTRQPEHFTVEGVPYVALPLDMGLNSLEATLRAPTKLKQMVGMATHESFVAYLSMFGDPTRSVVFANRSSCMFMAIVDYHEDAKKPSFNQHRAVFTMAKTVEWQEWMAANNKAKSQEEFAAFWEEHIRDIARPDGTDLLSMARNLEINKEITFKSSRKIEDGSVQFIFNESVAGSGGSMKVPSESTLALRPFEDSESAVPVRAKLRYRLKDQGQLQLWFELQEVNDILKDEFTRQVVALRHDLANHVRCVLVGDLL